MSHQTGIKANEQLKKYFSKCRDGKIRLLKVSIENEQLTLSIHKEIKSSCWEKDFDKMVPPLIEENQPCYIIFRLDTKNSLGYDWLFISWTPDEAPVRQKMLYASTKATLKQEFGSALIKEEFHATGFEDISLNGYNRYKKSEAVPAPLTNREEELKELQKSELSTQTNINSRLQTIKNVDFPISDDAKEGLNNFKKEKYDYVQFKIDVEKETIFLSKTNESTDVTSLSKLIPSDTARYHLYRFVHEYENEQYKNVIFIYSIPASNCSVKERMVYSSGKAAILDKIEAIGININKKLEIDDGDEINMTYLIDELHPKTYETQRCQFAKPKGPPNRGAKRITKTGK